MPLICLVNHVCPTCGQAYHCESVNGEFETTHDCPQGVPVEGPLQHKVVVDAYEMAKDHVSVCSVPNCPWCPIAKEVIENKERGKR